MFEFPDPYYYLPYCVFSRAFDCPSQRNKGPDEDWTYHEYDYNAWTNWNSGDLWFNPKGYEKDPAPVRPPYPVMKITAMNAQRYCQFIEPEYHYPGLGGNPPWYPFPYRSSDCVGYAYDTPHLNQTTCGGFLDGHAEVFTRVYLLGYAARATATYNQAGYPFNW